MFIILSDKKMVVQAASSLGAGGLNDSRSFCADSIAALTSIPPTSYRLYALIFIAVPSLSIFQACWKYRPHVALTHFESFLQFSLRITYLSSFSNFSVFMSKSAASLTWLPSMPHNARSDCRAYALIMRFASSAGLPISSAISGVVNGYLSGGSSRNRSSIVKNCFLLKHLSPPLRDDLFVSAMRRHGL